MRDSTEAMLEMANNMWDGFFRDKVLDVLGNYVSYYRATVTAAYADGFITVQEPFDHEHVIRCAANASGLAVGDQCIVLMLGGPQNSLVIGNGTMSNALSTTNTIAYNIRRNNGTYLAATALYRYQILLSKNETTLLPVNAVNNNTGTSKTLTTEEFNPFGPYYYYYSTGTVSSGGAIAASRIWKQYTAVNLRYSFNTGTTLTANRDIYLVCAPQTNGMAKLHTAPISQSLPTTADNLIYVHLGHAYSNYQISLDIEHPIYQFKNGKLQLYTGA